MDDIGRYALARRDLDRGGSEKVLIVTELPVSRARMDLLALDHDRVELENDPSSPYRWFVVRLADDEGR
ncbi:hypothetical protein [Pinisolibacter sp.]|uniref:hypothetical protein n=1 Tax=Pinisolibacter sp. TaxID=2172024 RepID=UPI002FDC91A6